MAYPSVNNESRVPRRDGAIRSAQRARSRFAAPGGKIRPAERAAATAAAAAASNTQQRAEDAARAHARDRRRVDALAAMFGRGMPHAPLGIIVSVVILLALIVAGEYMRQQRNATAADTGNGEPTGFSGSRPEPRVFAPAATDSPAKRDPVPPEHSEHGDELVTPVGDYTAFAHMLRNVESGALADIIADHTMCLANDEITLTECNTRLTGSIDEAVDAADERADAEDKLRRAGAEWF